MVRRVNLPSINQHREEEKEGSEAGATPGPRHRASQGQRVASEEVDVETSKTGLGQGNVLGNTLGGSTLPPERRVNFSPGVRTPPGRGGQTIGQCHDRAVELARRRVVVEGSAYIGAMRGMFPHTVFPLALQQEHRF